MLKIIFFLVFIFLSPNLKSDQIDENISDLLDLKQCLLDFEKGKVIKRFEYEFKNSEKEKSSVRKYKTIHHYFVYDGMLYKMIAVFELRGSNNSLTNLSCRRIKNL
tara:strand:+ start:386 stop:703 length:318 start_codon:yes stop_codon:yes gene_type:complete